MSPKNTPKQKPSEQDEIEVTKKTLKDLPESGEDVKGGHIRIPTIGTGTIVKSTVIC